MSQQTVLLNHHQHHDHLLSSPSSSSTTSSPSLKKRLGSAFSRIRKQSKSNGSSSSSSTSKSSTEKSNNNKPAPTSLHHPSKIKRHSSDVGPHHGTNHHHHHSMMNDDDANSSSNHHNNNTSSYYSAHNNNDTDTLSSNAQSDVDVKSAPAKLKKTTLDDLDSPLKHYNHTNTRNKRSSLQFSSSPSKSSFLSNNNNSNNSSSGISAVQDFNDDHASLSKTQRRSTSLHNIFALTQHDSSKAVVEQLSHQSYQPIKNDSYHNNNNNSNNSNTTSPSITIGKNRRSIFSASNNRKRKSNSHHMESAIELDRIPLDSVHYQPENMPSLSTSPSNKQNSSNSRAVRLIQALTPRRMGGLLTPRNQQHQLTSGSGNSTNGGYHHHQSASMQDNPTKTTSNSSSSIHSASSQVLISNHHNDGTHPSVMVEDAEQHSHVLAATTNTVGGSLNSASNIDFSSRNQRDDFYEKLSSNSGVAEHGQHASTGHGHYHERLTSFDTNSENTSSIILQDFDDSERFSLDVHSTAVFQKKLAAALSSTPSTPVTPNNDASVVVDSDVNANRKNDDENSVVVDRVAVDQDTASEGIMDDSNVNEMKSSLVGSTRSRSTPKRQNKRNLAYFSPSSSPRSKETSPSQSSSYQKEMPPETRRSVAALLAHAVASRKTSSNNESLHDPDQSINATTEKGDGTSQILTDDEFTAEDDESTEKIMGDQSPRKKDNFVIPSLSLGTMSSNITSNIVVDDNSSSSSSNSLTVRTARTNTGSSEEVTVEQLIHQYASMNKAERLRDLLIRERERLRQLEDDDLNLSAMLSELVNCADSRDNSTPLHKAAAKNNCEALEILLKEFKETKIDAKDNLESTALHWACANNALEAIFILCKFGASINVRDRYGFAPIHLTIKKKCFRGADVLLLYNGDINFKMSNGSTALHWACENNEMEIVKWLMRKDKVNPHARDKLKETPILRAATKGNMEVIEYFLQNNLVQWNLRDDKMQSLLHKAAYYGNNDLIMRVANANPIATGAMMNERDRDGNTPLHLAVRKDQFRAMKSLLLMGAEMNIQNKHGNTPLHIAVEMKDYKTARYLHQSSANADLKNKKGQTPRDIAALHAKELPPNTILRVHEDPMKIFV